MCKDGDVKKRRATRLSLVKSVMSPFPGGGEAMLGQKGAGPASRKRDKTRTCEIVNNFLNGIQSIIQFLSLLYFYLLFPTPWEVH